MTDTAHDLDLLVFGLRATIHGGDAVARDNTSLQPDHIKNTVAVQRGLNGGIGWSLTSWVRPARLGRRGAAKAFGRAHV